MQRRALARRTPNTGIDLLDTDAFNARPVRPHYLELDQFHRASIQAGHFGAIAISARGFFERGTGRNSRQSSMRRREKSAAIPRSSVPSFPPPVTSRRPAL